ncbi:MAG: hypothetical protein H6858_06590 [Rhodospirillales bacterium]|nr:hypothetical protein [Rhodospirillales bacterium]
MGGTVTEGQQIESDYRDMSGAFRAARRLLNLPDFPEYTPQVGADTKAAFQTLLGSISTTLTPEAKTEELYRRISPNIPPGLKERLDADPTAKAAFMQTFLSLDAQVDYLDRFYRAGSDADAGPESAIRHTFTEPQRAAIRNAIASVTSEQVPATFDNAMANDNLINLTGTAHHIAESLHMDISGVSDANLGQAIETKLRELRMAFVSSQANPDAVTQTQIDQYFRTTFNLPDLGRTSRVAAAMKAVSASGAFSAPTEAPHDPTPRAPVQPDAQTLVAMRTIREQVLPALDMHSSGDTVEDFRRDFARMSVKLAQMFQIEGNPNSPEVRAQIRTKLETLATDPDLGTLRDLASLPAGAGPAAFRTALVHAKGQAAYDRLPQAVKADPSMLFALLDNRVQITGAIDQIYASHVLERPSVTVAQSGGGEHHDDEEHHDGGGEDRAPAQGGPVTLTADQIGIIKTAHESLYGAVTGTYGNTEATASAARIQQEALALLGPLGAQLTAETLPQVAPQLGQVLRQAIDQHRAQFATSTGSGDQAAYLANLRLVTGQQDLTIEHVNKLIQALDQMGAAHVYDPPPAPEHTDDAHTAGGSDVTGPPTDAQVRAASRVVEEALIRIGGAVSQMGGSVGGLNISGLAGFTPPTTADGDFDEQSQNALHMVLMGLKSLGGDKHADGTYNAAVGQQLLTNILTRPEYAMVRQQYGITGQYTADHVRNMQTFMDHHGQADGVSEEDKEKVEELRLLFQSLDVLERANKLNNERARSVTMMGTIMDRLRDFLPESMKGWLRNFFENDQFGQMIAGFLNMFGFPIQRLWGGEAPGNSQVRETVRSHYLTELEAAHYDHAELKRRILERMDDSVAFKAVERLLFHGAERGTVRAAVEMALDRAARESDPNRAADVFADEMIRLGGQYQQLSPELRANYLEQIRSAYQDEVRNMPGVPHDDGSGHTDGGPDLSPGHTAPETVSGVPEFTQAHLHAVQQAMTLVGMDVPSGGLTREAAKTAIEQIHDQAAAVLTKMGVDTAPSRYTGSYDDIGRRLSERLAEERHAYFNPAEPSGTEPTEAGFKELMSTRYGIDVDQASKLAQAFHDVHASGAMNLGVPEIVPAHAGGDDHTADHAADGVRITVGDKQYELVFTPNTTRYPQAPMRYSHGRVGIIQNILSQNSAALELSTRPETYMKGTGGAATDTMTPATCMALEELVVRAQLAKGVELSAVSHEYDDTTIAAVEEYMRSKGMNQQDINRFVTTMRDLDADMKSTSNRDRNAGPVQPISVWDQSYVHNQVSLRPVTPTVAPEHHAEEAPVDRYPGIHMSPDNELPPGMSVEEAFDLYKKHNEGRSPNCGPLILQREGKVYAGVVIQSTNTFKVIELDGYLDPADAEHSRRQTLNDDDYALLRDNYHWHNSSKEGIIAYIDRMLCIEPHTPVVSHAAEAESEQRLPPVREEFDRTREVAAAVPQSYWELPRLSDDLLEGLDHGCMNARELTFLYDRAVATGHIQDGGAMLTMLNAEDKARLGGDVIITVRDKSTGELQHRLVDFDRDKIKIGGVTENYSPTATVRRLDDFLNTRYDQMAITVASDAMGTSLSEGYRSRHPHSVDDALRQLFHVPITDSQGYYHLQQAYENGENMGQGEQGFFARQMLRAQASHTLPVGVVIPVSSLADHVHGSCDEFNDRGGFRPRSSYGYEHYRGPAAPLVRLIGRVGTGNIGDGHRQLLEGVREQEIRQNTGDCGVYSHDAVGYYEVGRPTRLLVDPTPGGVIDH